jgi:hypothetical protein
MITGKIWNFVDTDQVKHIGNNPYMRKNGNMRAQTMNRSCNSRESGLLYRRIDGKVRSGLMRRRNLTGCLRDLIPDCLTDAGLAGKQLGKLADR